MTRGAGGLGCLVTRYSTQTCHCTHQLYVRVYVCVCIPHSGCSVPSLRYKCKQSTCHWVWSTEVMTGSPSHTHRDLLITAEASSHHSHSSSSSILIMCQSNTCTHNKVISGVCCTKITGREGGGWSRGRGKLLYCVWCSTQMKVWQTKQRCDSNS